MRRHRLFFRGSSWICAGVVWCGAGLAEVSRGGLGGPRSEQKESSEQRYHQAAPDRSVKGRLFYDAMRPRGKRRRLTRQIGHCLCLRI